MINSNFDQDKAAIQRDDYEWKVLAPDGQSIRHLDIDRAARALMAWDNADHDRWWRSDGSHMEL